MAENSIQLQVGARTVIPITETQTITETTVDQINIGIDGAAGFVPTDTTQPTVSTFNVTENIPGSVTFNGRVTDNGGLALTTRGFIFSSEHSTLSDIIDNGSSVTEGGTTVDDVFSVIVESLSAETTYYYVAFATNADSTGYGSVVSFTTMEAGVGAPASRGGGLIALAEGSASIIPTFRTTSGNPVGFAGYAPISAPGFGNIVKNSVVGIGSNRGVALSSGPYAGSGAASHGGTHGPGCYTHEQLTITNLETGTQYLQTTSQSLDDVTTGSATVNTGTDTALVYYGDSDFGFAQWQVVPPSNGLYSAEVTNLVDGARSYGEFLIGSSTIATHTTNLTINTVGCQLANLNTGTTFSGANAYTPSSTDYQLGPISADTSADAIIAIEVAGTDANSLASFSPPLTPDMVTVVVPAGMDVNFSDAFLPDEDGTSIITLPGVVLRGVPSDIGTSAEVTIAITLPTEEPGRLINWTNYRDQASGAVNGRFPADFSQGVASVGSAVGVQTVESAGTFSVEGADGSNDEQTLQNAITGGTVLGLNDINFTVPSISSGSYKILNTDSSTGEVGFVWLQVGSATGSHTTPLNIDFQGDAAPFNLDTAFVQYVVSDPTTAFSLGPVPTNEEGQAIVLLTGSIEGVTITAPDDLDVDIIAIPHQLAGLSVPAVVIRGIPSELGTSTINLIIHR